MKKMFALVFLVMLLVSGFSQAQDNQGAYVGAAYLGTINDDCSFCDTGGASFEFGYDFNDLFSAEIRKAENEYYDFNASLSLTYIGANIGQNFNTEWFRLYGKVGYIDAKTGEFSDSSSALGAGVRFSPQGNQNGFQLKIEVMRDELFNSKDTAIYAGFSFKFDTPS